MESNLRTVLQFELVSVYSSPDLCWQLFLLLSSNHLTDLLSLDLKHLDVLLLLQQLNKSFKSAVWNDTFSLFWRRSAALTCSSVFACHSGGLQNLIWDLFGLPPVVPANTLSGFCV